MYKVGSATDVTSVIAAVYDAGFYSQVNNEAVFLTKLAQNGSFRPHTDISNRFRIELAASPSGGVSQFNSGADFAAATDGSLLEGDVSWARFERTISVANDAYVGLTQGNPAAVRDVTEMVMRGAESVAKQVNAYCITRLATAIAASGTSEAGIVGVDGWEASVISSPDAFSTSGLRALQADIATLYGRRIGRGDFWLASPETYNLWDDAQADEGGQRHVIALGDRQLNEGGVELMARDGAIVLEDADCPADVAYAVRSKDIQLRFLTPNGGVTDVDGIAPFFWIQKAFTGQGHFRAVNVSAYVQLIVPRRFAHGKYLFDVA